MFKMLSISTVHPGLKMTDLTVTVPGIYMNLDALVVNQGKF